MSEENKKWLTDQLLDLFDKCTQIKDLKPALIGMTKSGQPRYKKSPKLIASLKMLLLAIAKYPDCIMGLKKLGHIASLSRSKTIDNLKILDQNGIIITSARISDCGDSDSNRRSINMQELLSFFDDGGSLKTRPPSLKTRPQVVSKRDQGVVSKRDPIKQDVFINGINQDKSFYRDQKINNEKKPSWAPMANESAAIKKHEKIKEEERKGAPENFQEMIKEAKMKLIGEKKK